MIDHPRAHSVHFVLWLLIGLVALAALFNIVGPDGVKNATGNADDVQDFIFGLIAAGALTELLFG